MIIIVIGVVLLGSFLFIPSLLPGPRSNIELTDVETRFAMPLFRGGECSAIGMFKLVNRGDADGLADVHLLVFGFSVASDQFLVPKHSSVSGSITDPTGCRGLTSSSPLEQIPPIRVVIVRVLP